MFSTEIRRLVRTSNSKPISRLSSKIWSPKRKLGRPEMQMIKDLHLSDPTVNTYPSLSEKFGISYEAVKRICKSKYNPKHELVACQGNAAKSLMDLSVLKGKDPAGYAAEEAFRKREKEAGQEGGSPQKYHISGSIAAADSGQFHIYRKKRRAELDRLSKFEQEAAELDADEKHSRHLEELKSKFEEKTEKNRAKRMKKKAKAAQMTKKTPSASTEKS